MKSALFLAFGGNQGDVLNTFTKAFQFLKAHGVLIENGSRAYLTGAKLWPQPGKRQPEEWAPPYWNAVVRVRFRGDLGRLWALCQMCERRAGRNTNALKWASRPLTVFGMSLTMMNKQIKQGSQKSQTYFKGSVV